MKLTPVLVVDEIEKCLPFWVERMGFAKTVEVPEGGRLGFVILVNERAELMLQTRESVRKDAPHMLPPAESVTSLFIEVEDFGDVLRRLEGYPIALEERVTFYKMREIGVREPAGNTVVFAAWVKEAG